MKLSPQTLFATLAVATLAGCGTQSSNRAAKPPCCEESNAPTMFTDKSIYQTESTWTTDQQKQIKLGELSGRPQVVAMFFVNCQFACPIIVNDMKRIETALSPELRQIGRASCRERV